MDIGGPMKVDKYLNSIRIFVCLMIFLIFFYPFYIEGDSRQKDLILDYVLNKLISCKKCKKDYRFAELSKFYIRFGLFENVMQVLDLVKDDYHKYSIICKYIENNKRLSDSEIIKLEKIIHEITDEELKFDVLCKLIRIYFKRGDNKKALVYFKIVKDNFDDEIKHNEFNLLISLIDSLKKNGLDQEVDELLKEYEDFAFSSNGNFLSRLNVFEDYFNLKMYENADNVLIKIEKEIDTIKNNVDKADRFIKLSSLMFEIEDFKKADEFLIKSLYYCNNISDKYSKVKCLVNFLKSIDWSYLYSSASNINSFEDILLKNIDFDGSNIIESSIGNIYNNEVIKFLIKNGNILKARVIAEKLDIIDKKMNNNYCFRYLDCYHYYLGEKYLESKNMKLKALSLSKRIQCTPMKKLELLLKIAEFYFEKNYEEKYFEIINEASLISINNNQEKDDFLGKIAMGYLKAGYINEALELTEKISYLATKSALIYEIAQTLICNCRIELIRKILEEYEIDKNFRAYIISKIGAKFMIEGKEKESEEMFKKSIDLAMTTDTGSIEIILNDYLNAKKYKRIIKYNAREKLNVLD